MAGKIAMTGHNVAENRLAYNLPLPLMTSRQLSRNGQPVAVLGMARVAQRAGRQSAEGAI